MVGLAVRVGLCLALGGGGGLAQGHCGRLCVGVDDVQGWAAVGVAVLAEADCNGRAGTPHEKAVVSAAIVCQPARNRARWHRH